jgi:protein-S-isoprenylcysteine O-methyltransferase Ste14
VEDEVTMPDPALQLAAIAYHFVSRMAYVLWVGRALRRQRRGFAEGLASCEDDFNRFRRTAAPIMANEVVSFVVLCFVARSSAVAAALGPVGLWTGAALLVVGVGIKAWATSTLGLRAFYWYDFFCPAESAPAAASGPYRFFRNPMYSLGYAHCYGLALLTGSLPGLVFAAFDQATMLVFYQWVERPHVERLYGFARDVRLPQATSAGAPVSPAEEA